MFADFFSPTTFADFFSPTTIGVCLIVLTYYSFMNFKDSQIADEEIKELKARICNLERSCEDLKGRKKNLQNQINFLQEMRNKHLSYIQSVDRKADKLAKEIKGEIDDEEWLKQFLHDDKLEEDKDEKN